MNTLRNLIIETDIAIQNGAVIEAVEGRDFHKAKVVNIEDYRRNKQRKEVMEDVKLVVTIVAIAIVSIVGIFLF